MPAQVGNDRSNATQIFGHRTPIIAIERRGMQKNHRLPLARIPITQPGSIRFIPTVHIPGGYAPGSPTGSSGIPIQPAT